MNLLTYHLFARLIAEVAPPLDPQRIFTPDTQSFLNFNPYNILAGLVFGTIGWGAFSYGKRLDLWQPRAIGVAMMVYPYLISNAWLLWGAGFGLMVVLWFFHHE
ncbi:MAG: hypothetical protein WCJ14_04490 [Verrucomicrobiota bacterium]